jgi:hypothetical protein
VRTASTSDRNQLIAHLRAIGRPLHRHKSKTGIDRSHHFSGLVGRCLGAATGLSALCLRPSFRLSSGAAWCDKEQALRPPMEYSNVIHCLTPGSFGEDNIAMPFCPCGLLGRRTRNGGASGTVHTVCCLRDITASKLSDYPVGIRC